MPKKFSFKLKLVFMQLVVCGCWTSLKVDSPLVDLKAKVNTEVVAAAVAVATFFKCCCWY